MIGVNTIGWQTFRKVAGDFLVTDGITKARSIATEMLMFSLCCQSKKKPVKKVIR